MKKQKMYERRQAQRGIWVSATLMDEVAKSAKQDARTLRYQTEKLIALGLCHDGPLPEAARRRLARIAKEGAYGTGQRES